MFIARPPCDSCSPLPIRWGEGQGEGLISASVLRTPLLPYSHARASANGRLAPLSKLDPPDFVFARRRETGKRQTQLARSQRTSFEDQQLTPTITLSFDFVFMHLTLSQLYCSA